MSDPIRYIVLTEASDQHHVAVARSNPATGWVQIIATFARRDRAEGFAEMENSMMLDDPADHEGWRPEDHEQPPALPEPMGGANHAVEIIERSRETTRMVSYTTGQGRPRPAGALVNEILGELPALIEEFPKGPTARIISERLCVEEHFVRRALREIGADGKAVYMKRRDSPAHHLVPLDYEPPEEELTATQEMVLATMCRMADTQGVVRAAKRQIALQSRCAIPSVQCVLDALERKGRVEGVDKPRGGEAPAIYRVLRMLEQAP